MAKLYLKFEQAVLKEFSLAQGVVTIGRLPDNLIQVDNLAVSGHHAKVYWDADHYVLEDNNSLNGTFVNNRRISKAVLKDGDEVLVGKHTIVFKEERKEDASSKAPTVEKTVAMVPTLEATVVLDTRKAKEMLARQAATPATPGPAAAAPPPPPPRERTGVLTVMSGKTDQAQYTLTGKLTVIGKSDMASIRLKGWFAPKVAAVINHRDAKYFIAASEKNVKVKVNDEIIAGQHELAEGDVVQVHKVKMTFSYHD
jgi:pSer/pThr/pTyr-binding forkhead associated (FHA) protein